MLENNLVFKKEEIIFITKKICEGENVQNIRRSFRKKFYPKTPRKVPNYACFLSVKKRLIETGSAHPQTTNPKRSPTSPSTIERVKDFFTNNREKSIREAAESLGLSYGTAEIFFETN